MNNEIKEILDRLDAEEFELPEYSSPISWAEMFKIRDYITNLQNENIFLRSHQKLDETFFKWNLEDMIKENERLKEELKNRPIVDFTFDTYKELEQKDKEIERLNNRIDKAIEYIKSNYIDNPIEFKKDLLKILKGSDKDENKLKTK